MNRTREPPVSNCERDFLLEAIRERKRLDGREVYDFRDVELLLSESPGNVTAILGNTRVHACVSCEVVQPQPHRPTEGSFFFNVELSAMAAPNFEIGGRPSPLAVEIARTLERCFKESRAVDTESLCIVAGEKVWTIRVDVHVLDHGGNIVDCAALASITALKHFRRPDVTVIGEDATIHPISEREPVPLSVHHMPLCVTFAFFCAGEYLLVDPSFEEEQVMDGKLIVAMNVHREICALQMTGGVALLPDQVHRCAQIAAVKVKEMTEIVKSALNISAKSLDSSSKEENSGGQSVLVTEKNCEDVMSVEMPGDSGRDTDNGEVQMAVEEEDSQADVIILGERTAEIGSGGCSNWDHSSVPKADDDKKETKGPSGDGHVAPEKPDQEEIVDLCESEEEMVITMTELGGFSRSSESVNEKKSRKEIDTCKEKLEKKSQKEIDTCKEKLELTTAPAASKDTTASSRGRKKGHGKGRSKRKGGRHSNKS